MLTKNMREKSWPNPANDLEIKNQNNQSIVDGGVEKVDQEKSKAFEGAKTKISMVFGFYETGRERVDDIKLAIDDYLGVIENREEIHSALDACAGIVTRKEFIENVFGAIKPLIELGIERSEVANQEIGEDREFVKINELLSYGIGEDNIHIHIVPEEKIGDMLVKFKEGLHQLAGIVNEHQEIKTVDATSWIVAKHPKIVERFGFALDGEISEEDRRGHFPGEKSKIHAAHMLRDDFLQKYLIEK